MARPWFEERPGLLEAELEALEDEGIGVELREDDRRRGQIVLDLEYPVEKLELAPPPVEEDHLRLRARYPDNFPYFRPEVETDHVDLPRHHGPGGGNLCLLGRATVHWDSNQSLAQLLEDQLETVFREGRITDPEELAEREGEQAEPFSDYYSYSPGTSFLIDPPDDLSQLTNASSGRLVLGFQTSPKLALRGAVLDIREEGGNSLSSMQESIVGAFSNCRFGGRWVRLDSPVSRHNAPADLRARAPEVLRPPREWQRVDGGSVDVIGVVFPEEVAPGEEADGWVFVVFFRREGQARAESQQYFCPAMRIGEEHRFARAPELAPLRDKVVSVVGLGCLGAPSALEFAKAGVQGIRMVDHDTVDAATTIRWPFGLPAAGTPKVNMIGNFISTHHPYCEVEVIPHKIGITDPNAEHRDSEVVERLLEEGDLLYDASAEWGVQHYLSQRAREAGVPYIAVGGRHGGWGGVVLRDDSTSPGCWGCYHRHIDDGTFDPPSSDPSGDVQPTGCADPTFTGANFDLQQVAMMGVRLAVATLCRGEGGYPDFPWNVATLSLRDTDGSPHEPRWETDPLEPHPDCGACQ